MPNKIEKKDVIHIAKLSRLSYDDIQAEKFTEELNNILVYIDKLDELDTSSIEPTSHALDISNVFRDDESKSVITKEAALSNAPEGEHGHFKVPRVIE